MIFDSKLVENILLNFEFLTLCMSSDPDFEYLSYSENVFGFCYLKTISSDWILTRELVYSVYIVFPIIRINCKSVYTDKFNHIFFTG